MRRRLATIMHDVTTQFEENKALRKELATLRLPPR